MSFISIAHRFCKAEYQKHETLKDAVSFLEYGDEYEHHFSLAVIDTESKKMVWFNDFLSQREAERNVEEYLKNHP